ncbi:hypothetical protein QBC47DRAFT_457411 [Echria macrotheca]|uniref:Zn(2)-C6 fungal-type domain-containing protein n=1 Tax=Echria macrotheca TaxID=438768 RepID=A0AAJ0BKV4_9PEZI|nr:hypothetical protein QBC47DRAFT_457411 [Echria macrotheca]
MDQVQVTIDQVPVPVPVPVRRRRRPAVSCTQCRARKIRCNRENPCNNCLKSRNAVCSYDSNGPPQSVARSRAGEQPAGPATASAIRVGVSHDDTDRDSHATTVTSNSRSELDTPASSQPDESPAFSSDALSPAVTKTAFTCLSDAFFIHYDQDPAAPAGTCQAQPVARCVSHKTRLFGQSHWATPSISLLRDLVALLEKGNHDKVRADVQRCKSIGKLAKMARSPPWPTVPTMELPQKELADQLVDCYLRTIETVYRVVHIPTFRRSYDDLWLPGSKPELGFVMQVKLVLAIGSTMYDDTFSLRTSAIRWVHEAMSWNSAPDGYKSRLTIQGLQNQILLLFAQEIVGVGRDMVWSSSGSLVLTAMHMGLHRDPSRLQPRITLYACEMRRRLWNTVIELALQSSLNAGGTILLSLDDFDTLPPNNFDDAELESPSPTPPSPLIVMTQTTIPIVLRRTFAQRLAIVKFLNGLCPSSPASDGLYTETLALDTALRSAYRTLAHSLQLCPQQPTLSTILVDLLTRRYLLALHVPFLELALSSCPQSRLLYSRTEAVDNALRIWNAARFEDTLFRRFATNGATFIRTTSAQAAFVAAAELRAQILAERDSLVPPVVRADLLAVVNEAQEWSLKCVEVGETNMKGHLFLSIVRAQIEAARERVDEETMVVRVVRAAEESAARCLPAMERNLEKVQGESAVDVGEMDFDAVAMPEFLFGFENAESLSWDFT